MERQEQRHAVEPIAWPPWQGDASLVLPTANCCHQIGGVESEAGNQGNVEGKYAH